MKTRSGLITFLLGILVITGSFAQEIPLVYDVENSGADCPPPPLPEFSELPVIDPLTDPFEWSDRSSRDTSFVSWRCRRAEIKAEIENYEIGPKPDRPDTIEASFANDTLTVHITKNGNTLTLTSRVTLPEGDGPFPALIGIGSGFGNLPADIFTSRDIALISFDFWEVMAHTQTRGSEPINKLYPDLIYMGAYSAWSWGVSRLIDGLELVSEDLPIDLRHLAITGCSYAGKMALFAGAFDERIALTIAQESGGGGAAAWRVSQTLPGVESLGATSHAWFIESMFQFSGFNVSKLPHDHHELMAMVAPRALLVIGNPDFVWLAEESGYVSCMAAKKVWDNFGISDRFGFSFVGGHGHCALPEVQRPEVEAFVDRFLLGDTTASTSVSTHSYDYVIPTFWTDWWGTGDPDFPAVDRGDSEEYWFEAECAEVGNAWNVRIDTTASNESYATSKPGLESVKGAPESTEGYINFPFTVTAARTFYVYARINCPLEVTGSFWLQMDDGRPAGFFQFRKDGWKWSKLKEYELTAGDHNFSVGFRQEGAKLDKICISDFSYTPGELGEAADFSCIPDTTTKIYTFSQEINTSGNYLLDQNYPNPFHNITTIAFEIPRSTTVSLKVYSVISLEIAELAGKEYPAGRHTVDFDARSLPAGIYYYSIITDSFTASRGMILQTE